VKDFLKSKNVDIKYALVNRHRQNSVIESQNYRLGSLILKYQALNEIESKKKQTAWHQDLPKFIKYLNDTNKVKKKARKYDPYEDVAGNENHIELLNEGDKVRHILDYPINAHNDKRVDSRFRSGDIRWSQKVYKIMRIILNPGIPPLYMLNMDNDENKIDSSVAYTRAQLLKVKS